MLYILWFVRFPGSAQFFGYRQLTGQVTAHVAGRKTGPRIRYRADNHIGVFHAGVVAINNQRNHLGPSGS